MTTDRDDTGHLAPRRARFQALRPAVVAALLAGLALRLAFGLGYWVDKPLTHDEREYLLLARNIAVGRGFQHLLPDGSQAPGENFGRAPIYPLMLAAIMRVSGLGIDSVTSPTPISPETGSSALLILIRIVQAVIGVLVVWVVAGLAGRAAGPAAASLAAWMAALYPPLVWLPAYVFSETLYSALALGCAAALGAAVGRHSAASPGLSGNGRAARIVLAGMLAGLAILTRPVMLFFVPLAVPWLWWKRGVGAAALLLVTTALVVAPWTIRNAATYGRFVLVASEGGVTFWTGNHPLAIGEGDLAANPEMKKANVEFRARHAGLSPEQLEPLYYQDAVKWIGANPGAAVTLVARKAFYSIVPIGPSYQLHSPRYFWASVLAYLAVLPFAILGFLGLVRRAAAPQPLLLLAVSSLLVCLVFFPQERFRIPVIDPTLLICAAAWWALRSASPAAGPQEARA